MLFNADLTYGELFKEQQVELSDLEQEILMSQVTLITETDYNKILKLSGQDEIQLGGNNFIINANYEPFNKHIQFFLNKEGKIRLVIRNSLLQTKKYLVTLHT